MRRAWLFVLLAALPACRKAADDSRSEAVLTAAPIGGAECAACGMVVREQPAPRGQVVLHDGSRAFACSIADLLQYLAAPSSHGQPQRVFVESLPAEVAPDRINSKTPATWVDARSAYYVVGVSRPGVMGKPVLVYGKKGQAAHVAAHFGGRVVAWASLPREILGGDANP